MAFHITTANSISVASGNAFVHAGPDSVTVDIFASIVSNFNGIAMKLTGSWTADINGLILAKSGDSIVLDPVSAADTSTFNVGVNGQIQGSYGLRTTEATTVTNHGIIQGTGGDGIFETVNANYTITNFNQIVGANGGSGIHIAGTGMHTINNSAVVQGDHAYAINSLAGVELITNNGVLDGKVSLGGGNDSLTNSLTAFVTGLVDMGDGVDTFIGSDHIETVIDGGGTDTYHLGGGNDVFLALKTGGAADGTDTVDGGAGKDLYDLSAALSNVQINLDTIDHNGFTASQAIGIGGTDNISGFEDASGGAGIDALFGSSAANVLHGNGNADSLFGYGGDDILDGGTGDDTLKGGLGNDAYYMNDIDINGRVLDTATKLANEGIDGVRTGVTVNLNEARFANIENGYLTGSSNASLGGSAVDNVLVGNTGNNSIYGLGGRDVMRGDLGVDTFVYLFNSDTGKTATTRDLIQDFTHLTDKIDLLALDANGALAGNGMFVFQAAVGAAFTGIAGQLHTLVSGANTLIEGDFNGDKVADFQIELTGHVTLAGTDFVL